LVVLQHPVGIAYALAAIVFAWIASVTWRRRAHNPTLAVSMVVVMMGLGVSSIADAVAVSSATQRTAAIASLAILPGVGIATGAFLCLGLGVARPQWTPRPGFIVLLLVEPALITVATATNPWHRWVYRGAGASELTGSTAWGYGPVFWWHTGYSYLAILIGIGFIAWGWWKAPPAFRQQRLTILLATLIACAANVAYLARGFGNLGDPTPFGFAIAGTVIFYAIFRQNLIMLSPVARALLIDQIGDAIMVISPGGLFLDLNPVAVDLVRALNPGAPTDLVGAPAPALFADGLMAPPGDRETEVVVEFDGARAEFQMRFSPLVDRRHHDLGTVLVARDVTESNNQSRRLSAAHIQLVRQVETIELLRADLAEQASRDPLTGLHNRRHLVDGFASMISAAEHTGEPLAVALFDIDRFKLVNDMYGHLAGDAVLLGLAQLMSQQAPPHALLARWGGEEFFVALPCADAATGLAFADDLRRRFELNEIVIQGRMIRCTLSGGVAAYPASGTTMDDLFHAADVSMYEAKKAGRNLVGVDKPSAVQL
jgi:diguanylate cyclase (GGDEF)-like protein